MTIEAPSAVRVRFAPSPTGHMHIGGIRTALFNWLFARHHGGTFLIRIEDTDQERSLPEYTIAIKDALAWARLESDEPLVIQSERKPRHIEVAHNLLQKGLAYKCYCTPQELRERIGESAASGEGYAFYDEKCRNLPEKTNDDRPYAIRFRVPDGLSEIAFDDAVRGHIVFNREQVDDFIIVRSDGSPMYNFVVVVDDADMGITHVIRGEEHLPNTPKQILLYKACGFATPQFAHLSLILAPDGSKLSKRDAATSVIDYKLNGFLADALCNYLVRLGWAHGDQEIFTRDELIRLFTLDEVGKKGAIFDIKKLEWMNGVFIRESTPHELERLIVRDIDPQFRSSLKDWQDETVYASLKMYQDRVKTLVELKDAVTSLYHGPTADECKALASYPAAAKNYVEYCLKEVENTQTIDRTTSEHMIKKVCAHFGIKMPELAQPLRVALTGKLSSPGVYDIFATLGKDTIIKRLRTALAIWEQQ